LHDLRIAVVGEIGEHKGESIILELLSLPKKERPKIVLFGLGSEVLTSTVDEYWGMYKPTQLLQNVVNAEIDAFWFPFRSYETFSYVLGETMCTNLPIFANNKGAVPERLAQYPFGYLLEPDSSPSKIIEKIEKVLLNDKNFPKPKSVKFSDLDYSHSWYLNKYVELIT
jgi:glycosyltransferase involved in cell wall biosynthesis